MKQFDVLVNGVSFPIVPHEVKKGKGKGNIKMRPDKSALTVANLLKAFGEEKIREELTTRINALCNGMTDEALEASSDGADEPQFEAEYSRMFSDLNPAGETVSILRDRLEEKLDELGSATEADQADLIKQVLAINKALHSKKSKDKTDAPEPVHA